MISARYGSASCPWFGAASAATRPTRQRQPLKLPGLLKPRDAEAGVGTLPRTETDLGATTTMAEEMASTMQGRSTLLLDAPVSASWRVRTSPTSITA
jgi:hypothetical protein